MDPTERVKENFVQLGAQNHSESTKEAVYETFISFCVQSNSTASHDNIKRDMLFVFITVTCFYQHESLAETHLQPQYDTIYTLKIFSSQSFFKMFLP